MSRPECLQMKTGSCLPCNIVTIALERAPSVYDRKGLEALAEEVARDWCPQRASVDPLKEALKTLRPTQSTW